VKRNLDVLDRSVPGWLGPATVLSVTVRIMPQREQDRRVDQEQLIVELYSK